LGTCNPPAVLAAEQIEIQEVYCTGRVLFDSERRSHRYLYVSESVSVPGNVSQEYLDLLGGQFERFVRSQYPAASAMQSLNGFCDQARDAERDFEDLRSARRYRGWTPVETGWVPDLSGLSEDVVVGGIPAYCSAYGSDDEHAYYTSVFFVRTDDMERALNGRRARTRRGTELGLEMSFRRFDILEQAFHRHLRSSGYGALEEDIFCDIGYDDVTPEAVDREMAESRGYDWRVVTVPWRWQP